MWDKEFYDPMNFIMYLISLWHFLQKCLLTITDVYDGGWQLSSNLRNIAKVSIQHIHQTAIKQ